MGSFDIPDQRAAQAGLSLKGFTWQPNLHTSLFVATILGGCCGYWAPAGAEDQRSAEGRVDACAGHENGGAESLVC